MIRSMEERLRIQQKEIDRMSSIHDQLLEKDKEVVDLKKELKKRKRSIPMPSVTMAMPPTKKSNPKKRVTMAEKERYKEDDIILGSSEDESSGDSDTVWRMTPLFTRIRKERQSLVRGPGANSRKNLTDQLLEKKVFEPKEQLNKQERSIPINLPCVTMTTHPTKKSNPKKRVTKAQVERYKEDDIILGSSEDESSGDSEVWRMSPLFTRIRKERKSLVGCSRANSRKNLTATSEMNQKSRSSSLKESHETPDIQEFFRRNSLQSHKEVQKKSTCHTIQYPNIFLQ
eukprot:TRINITY_DN17417_c0_g1_i7.p1 TRINITY_DN17417_c0_g1~~TRINITY_DN17417_c0_g1_i7.p1  ORF type:complete len:286 (-),score=79.03 TRINITY_DN17417_c0_g1_i7:128-985(-)